MRSTLSASSGPRFPCMKESGPWNLAQRSSNRRDYSKLYSRMMMMMDRWRTREPKVKLRIVLILYQLDKFSMTHSWCQLPSWSVEIQIKPWGVCCVPRNRKNKEFITSPINAFAICKSSQEANLILYLWKNSRAVWNRNLQGLNWKYVKVSF